MSKLIFKIVHDNNKLTIFNSKDEMLYNSIWFMEFGKNISEVFSNTERKLFTMTKKFQFWKWRMVYKIINNKDAKFVLIAQNNRNTIYKLNYKSNSYSILIHYKKRISILRNDTKIAELDASFKSEEFRDSIQLITNNAEELEMIFMLFSCVKIGESDQAKPVLKSQKKLETNSDPWT